MQEVTELITVGSLANVAVQSVDLTSLEDAFLAADVTGSIFLGCDVTVAMREHIERCGGLVFPRLDHVPFDAYRNRLYSPRDLLGGFAEGDETTDYVATLDGAVYDHYRATGAGQPADILEALARRLHDHAISDALHEFIEGRNVVAIMGGHAMSRTSSSYRQVVGLGRGLAQQGNLVTTGGGPGAMEAAHVGAWFADRPDRDLEQALAVLAEAPTYDPIEPWLKTAARVMRVFPAPSTSHESLGIPTWLYGHEPPTLFATHIAKYFANSVREEGLLAIAKGGIIYTPGSAGTVQEIFQDATQNHYVVHDVVSPMVLFGEDYWQRQKPVFPLLQALAADRDYARWIHITDDPRDALAFLRGYRMEKSLD